MLLEINDLTVCYEKAMIINGISLNVAQGELVSLVGPNGAGKSTMLRAITGLVAWEKEMKRRSTGGEITLTGSIIFDGADIINLAAHKIVSRGLIHCPERRRPFREMTVEENLAAGAYLLSDKKEKARKYEMVYSLFPRLKERARQISGTLSGGEQQMLAIGRALMFNPRLLCIDEPSTGLAPIMRAEVFEKIVEIKNMGITILLVEQEVRAVFKISTRNYVLSAGKIIAQGSGEELLENEVVRKTYLGL